MLKNATPHALTIHCEDTTILTVQPNVPVVRCDEVRDAGGTIDLDGHPVALTTATYGEVQGLDGLQAGDVLVCSNLAATAIVAQCDLLTIPDNVIVCYPGPAIRDADGRIVGCAGLTVVLRT